MELRVLRYFLIVAREENITKAAALLHLTQPTLSRQLRQLEEDLGVTLFYRTSHHIALTEDGMLFRRRAQEILDLTEKTKAEFSNEAMDLAGKIAIGCGETYNMGILADWMAAMQNRHPLVTFQVQSFTADVVLERLENGLLDLGLLMEPVDIRKYEILRMPLQEKWGILVRQDSALAQLTHVVPQDLAGLPLILPERLSVQNSLQRWFGNSYENLHLAATYNLMLNAVFMVKNGLGLLSAMNLTGFSRICSLFPCWICHLLVRCWPGKNSSCFPRRFVVFWTSVAMTVSSTACTKYLVELLV